MWPMLSITRWMRSLHANNWATARELEEGLEEIHHQVWDALKFSGEAMKLGYVVRASHVSYKKDQVWLYNEGERKHSRPNCRAPGKARTYVVTYRIERGERTKLIIVHSNRLWKYHGKSQCTSNQLRQEPDIALNSSNDENTDPPNNDAEKKTLRRRQMNKEGSPNLITRNTRKLIFCLRIV